MDQNLISDAGAIALAKNERFSALMLNNNQMENPAAFVFAQTKNLLVLEVGYNHIGKSGIQALKSNKTIHVLYVKGNDGENLNHFIINTANTNFNNLLLTCKNHDNKFCKKFTSLNLQ